MDQALAIFLESSLTLATMSQAEYADNLGASLDLALETFGVALEKWRAFGFGLCRSLEIAWAFVTERRMSPHRIIEPVDVASNGDFGR
ncbi:hypothetical protein [Azospirillum cavernae]|uniref:hypothetical protein n=1 Tax=Azospirillum cavernae TaxID=2320860 RepID=UPI0018F711C0|nr:hypothetical protein [Azospirillum cavernae]